MTNNKWFDKLTILSQVEGQYPNLLAICMLTDNLGILIETITILFK